eukprot:RCo015297
MADPMSVEARLPRRNSLDSLATALQNTPPIASTVSTFEIPQSLTLDAITHPVLACGTPEAEETALPAPPLDSFIISETTSSFTPIPVPGAAAGAPAVGARKEEPTLCCAAPSSLLRLARKGHAEARLALLGKLLREFLGQQYADQCTDE